MPTHMQPMRETKETLRQFFERRWSVLAEERNTWDQHWRELSEYILPRTSRFLSSTTGGAGHPGGSGGGYTGGPGTRGAASSRDDNWGGKKNDKIIDGTAGHAVQTLVAGLMSGVTSPARKWFKLLPPSNKLLSNSDVQRWIADAEEIMFDVFERSNLYQILPLMYEELCVYGTAAVGMFEDYENVVRFEKYSIGEYWINHDYKYHVNAFFRIIWKDVEQMVGEFCMKEGQVDPDLFANLSLPAQSAWNNMQYGRKFECMEVIVSREDRKFVCGSGLDFGDFPFVHCIYERGSSEDMKADRQPRYLHKGGFEYFPILVPRWHMHTPDVYGRSPGMEALGDVKQLQGQQRTKGVALQKMVNPPMAASPSMKQERLSTLPGDVTYLQDVGGSPSTGNAPGFRPLYQIEPRLQDFTADMDEVRERIRKHMFSDLFLAINSVRRSNVTATEIEARQEERLLLLGPVMLRLDEDLLKPLIDRTFDRLVDVNVLEPAPDELQGADLGVEYLSIIAIAQKQQSLLSIKDVAMFTYEIAAQQIAAGETETAADRFDADQAVKMYGRSRGIDPSIVVSDDDLAEKRERKRQEMQEAQMAQAAMSAPQAARDLGSVATGPAPQDNAAADVVSAMAGDPRPTPGER